ncbi:MAG: DUF3667 domain-containing protein [Pseudomonadota bacterium]
MSDVTDGIGGAIEGALTGRAVEPGHGEAGQSTFEPVECSNCGATVTEAYCSQCGQKRHVHRTISAILHDLIHGVLHLDGKLWRTLPLLAFKPGTLTRRYIDGERAKFVSPMAMLLFSVFAMFAVFQIAGITAPTTFENQIGMEQIETSVGTAIEDNERALREIEEQLQSDTLDADERRGLEARKLAVTDDLRALAEMNDLPFINADGIDVSVQPDGIRIAETTEDSSPQSFQSETGIDWIDNGLAKKWQDNPGLMLYKLQANAYKFSWLLIPLSIPFVWLIFAWKRRFKAYDHAIFVTYSLGFMSLLFITMSLIGISPLGPGWAFLVFAIVAPLHLYKHLKYTYELSRFSTLWRFLTLLVFILIVIVMFLQALLLLGAF